MLFVKQRLPPAYLGIFCYSGLHKRRADHLAEQTSPPRLSATSAGSAGGPAHSPAFLSAEVQSFAVLAFCVSDRSLARIGARENRYLAQVMIVVPLAPPFAG